VQILAQPADDTVRLVFADWLDEHGQPERAEFIRVQVQHAQFCLLITDSRDNMGNGWSLPSLEKEQCADLKHRERELWDRCGVGKSFDMHGLQSRLWWEDYKQEHNICAVRRGFVERVACTALDWATHAAAILAAHPVRRVGLTTDPNVGDVFHVWRNMKEGEPWQCERWPGIEFELLFLPQGTGGGG
jgi:uncharacterized protein (TIGR02996 family)